MFINLWLFILILWIAVNVGLVLGAFLVSLFIGGEDRLDYACEDCANYRPQPVLSGDAQNPPVMLKPQAD